jgi:hypothetical protein
MARILDEQHAAPAVAAMLGVCDTDGGPTDEQRSLIDALAQGYFHLEGGTGGVAPLGPAEVAGAFSTHEERTRVRELLVFLEQCRHPLTEAQVARTEEYTRALGADDETMVLARDLVQGGVAHAEADYHRILTAHEPEFREPTLAGDLSRPPVQDDPELVARILAFHDLAEGSLGRSFIGFYDRYGFDLPGSGTAPAAMFVSHDMNHVLSGYEPTGPGEIALGAMQLAITDSDEHWIAFLGNLGVHEAGYISAVPAPPAALARPGAAAMVAHAFDRGARCPVDFTGIDHLALVDQPLEQVRADLGIPPRDI